MARNGSGTYSTVNTFVAGTSITASDHNENWSDVASEMTNSVAVDGQSTMTGALKAASGTVALPGIAFGSDTDSGLYRIAANNIGVAVNGAKVIDVATTGASVVGNFSASADIDAVTVKQATFALLPPGCIFPYGGTAAPDGYLLCYGQAISRTTYAALFTALSTTYGVGDGSTTFNVPDLRGRVVAGQDDMGGSSANRLTNADDGLNGDTLGATGGGETQALVTANLPAYTPAGSVTTNLTNGVTSNFNGSATVGGSQATGDATVAVTASSTFTGTAQGGTSTAFGVVQPTIILNYIVKV